MVTRAAHDPGPHERAAMTVPVEDEKRRVLLAIARFADEGRDDPSVNEIHKRARVHWQAVVIKTEKLAREGWISITKPTAPSGERARYELHSKHPHERNHENEHASPNPNPRAAFRAQSDAAGLSRAAADSSNGRFIAKFATISWPAASAWPRPRTMSPKLGRSSPSPGS